MADLPLAAGCLDGVVTLNTVYFLDDLPALAGATRETTTKVLGEFAELGVIGLARGRVTILDAEALHDLAGE